MTTSGVYNLETSLNELLAETADILQIGADGETLSGDFRVRATRTLNLMLKAWEGSGHSLVDSRHWNAVSDYRAKLV